MTKKYTELFPEDLTYDKASRVAKAKKIEAILRDCLGDLSRLSCLDLGCSVGHITGYLGKHFKKTVGVDVDSKAVKNAKKEYTGKNISFGLSGENKIPFPNKSFDVIVFNQIYEHVENPERLFKEIKRILKKGGVCFFGARNKYGIFDGHYQLPFISWVPRFIADWYIRKTTQKKTYDIKLYSFGDLKNLTKGFIRIDYTLAAIEDPRKYKAEDVIPAKFGFNKLILIASKVLYCFIPNYLWVLKKKN